MKNPKYPPHRYTLVEFTLPSMKDQYRLSLRWGLTALVQLTLPMFIILLVVDILVYSRTFDIREQLGIYTVFFIIVSAAVAVVSGLVTFVGKHVPRVITLDDSGVTLSFHDEKVDILTTDAIDRMEIRERFTPRNYMRLDVIPLSQDPDEQIYIPFMSPDDARAINAEFWAMRRPE